MTKWDVARALKASDLPAPAKLIMWDLLDSADADTAVIPDQFTPSLNDLVRTTSLSRSTVKRELNRLEGDGWVARDRPDPVKARTEFARTGYRLAAPPRPTESLGPNPRPTVDPGLGPEGTEARPTVGRIPLPHHPDLDQSKAAAAANITDHRGGEGDPDPRVQEIFTAANLGPPWAPGIGAALDAGHDTTRILDELTKPRPGARDIARVRWKVLEDLAHTKPATSPGSTTAPTRHH